MTTAPDTAVVPQWTLADRLRKVRTQAKLQQRPFAEQLDVPYSRYAQWEAGNNQPRDVVALAKRIELLTGVPAAWTLGVLDDRHKPFDDGGGAAVRPRQDSNLRPRDYLATASAAGSWGPVTPLRERRANPLSRPAAQPERRAA